MSALRKNVASQVVTFCLVNATTGALYGLCAGLCWVAASYGISYLFERRPLALWLINGGYHTVQFTLIGLILGAWR